MNNRLTFILFVVLLSSCTKDGDILYVPDPDDIAKTSPLVTVLYDPDALGDRSYNDLIYQGVENAAKNHQVRTLQLSPLSVEEGEAYLENLFTGLSQTPDTVRRLIVVTSQAYDSFLRENSHCLADNPYVDLLYLETNNQLPDKGSTLFVQYYGAMYEAGVVASAFVDNAYVIGANPKNVSVNDAVMGFYHGFTAGYFKNKEDGFRVNYIGEDVNEGFYVEDGRAIEIMYQENNQKGLLVPICGGAGNVFYQIIESFEIYGTEDSYLYMGVDNARISPFCFVSAVKHIDRIMELCVDQWMSEEGLPKHQHFGLESGYTEMVLTPFGEIEQELMDEYFPDDFLQEIHKEALRKEAEYEK